LDLNFVEDLNLWNIAQKCHFDRGLSQLYRERLSGETRFSTEGGSTGGTADSSTPLRSGRKDALKKNEYSSTSLMAQPKMPQDFLRYLG
jgi:hypothetical protein